LPDEIRREVSIVDMALPDKDNRRDALAGVLDATGGTGPQFQPSAMNSLANGDPA
jgi:hypothetical protein